jgi:FkbM family methyltransferase
MTTRLDRWSRTETDGDSRINGDRPQHLREREVMRTLQIIKREIVIALSQIGLKWVATDYLGMRLLSPTIYGMVNGGYIVPGELWMSDCLEAFIGTRKGCVLDIGSNVGVYLVKLRVISREVEYFGVEPNHACNFYLQELIRLNRFEHARILPFAFSDHRGVGMIYAGGRGSKRGSALPSHRPGEDLAHSFEAYFAIGDEVVETLGLRELAVIKLDVEEGELEALQGLMRTIEKYRPYIYCEILETGGDELRIVRTRRICESVRGMDYAILGVEKSGRVLEIIDDIGRVGKDYWEEYIFAPLELVVSFQQAIRKNRKGVRVRETVSARSTGRSSAP